jgi:outer membrane receptor protein involved in Fe transport
MYRNTRLWLSAGAAALAFSCTANAQTAAKPAAAASEELSEVVVTGSRVIANGNNSPTPMTVISAAQLLEAQPTNMAAALQNLPVFQGSLGQNTGTGGGAGGPNGSANAVNIRNLGLNRTLVLYDGSRLQPTTDTGVVTLDMVPQMLLQRVDVVTGGVSAVYGSNAISGAVNLVTDKEFNGVKFKAQRGISALGDDPITDVGVAAGMNVFAGRGHIEGSLEYFNDEGIFDMFSRELGTTYVVVGAGSAANPYRLVSDARLSTTSFGGLITNGPLVNQNFTGNGTLYPFRNGTTTGSNGVQIGGDGGYYFNTSLKGSLRSRRTMARFDFDLTDTTHFYLQALGAKYTNAYQNQSLSFSNVVLSKTNAFLPAAYQSSMLAAAGTTFTLSKIPQQLGPHRSEFDMDSYQVFTGLNGKVGRYDWDVSLSHGQSTPTWNTFRNMNRLKLAAALDAVVNPANGQIVCRVTLTNPAAFPGCAPLNVFGPTAESAEALAYITEYTVTSATNSQDELAASIAGAPFSTWAGPLNLAVSGEWRQARFRTLSGVPATDLANCSLLPNAMNCTATTALHQVTFRQVVPVKQKVSEAAVEADVPLLKGVPLVQSLNLNLAARYASYSIGGSATVWKAGLDWHLNGELRVRATRSRDFRAPDLDALFSPTNISNITTTNVWTGLPVTAPQLSGGNPDLKPEVGNTLTAGIVYQPKWLSGSSLSVDFYNIKITNAFANETGSNIATQRRCLDSGGTSSYCALIVRNPVTNEITQFFSRSINAASTTAHGLDIEANYATRLLRRPLSLRLLSTWQPELRTVTALTDIDVAGSAGTPEWRATAFANYSPTDRFRVSVSQRWRSAVAWAVTDPVTYYAEPKVPSFTWTNLSLTYEPNLERLQVELYLNAQNVFNRDPPRWTTATVTPGVFGAYVRTDDFVGRYYTAGIRARL